MVAGAQLQEQTHELEAVRAAMTEERSAVAVLRQQAEIEGGAIARERTELKEEKTQLGFAEMQVDAMRVRAAEESAALTSEKVKVRALRCWKIVQTCAR